MSDERIHRHKCENGLCKVCGTEQPSVESGASEPPMSKRELGERLDRIEKRIGAAESCINIELMVVGLLLLVLVIRGC